MRLAVLSDIHANLAALEAVRDDMPQVDEVWALGDIVGYGPQPNEVIAALQEMGARSVMGNHDGAAIGQVDVSWFNPDAARAIGWTGEVIDDNARAYLGSLPEVRRDGDLTAVHGSPRDPTWEYITGARCGERQPGLVRHAHLPARPYPRADRVPRRRGVHGGDLRHRPDRRSPSATDACCSTRAASASRATAIRPRRTW